MRYRRCHHFCSPVGRRPSPTSSLFTRGASLVASALPPPVRPRQSAVPCIPPVWLLPPPPSTRRVAGSPVAAYVCAGVPRADVRTRHPVTARPPPACRRPEAEATLLPTCLATSSVLTESPSDLYLSYCLGTVR
ncbi:hypothetical protein E2562_016808 [Oryza meyeriana var. granulata]|uniref:Uncharacterized protein n=1 Tax=Oryza meyeriana var. granulata TaxID=110450 RepID=A0A6G1BXK0_9ORYZ|nr:hypothetical protein E2562_016808 [Oryza meyeriana var. granulata]